MKRFTLLIFTLFYTLSYFSYGQAIRYVGTGEEFTDLTAVAAWLNSNALTQNTDFVIKDSYVGTSESAPITINQNAGNFTIRIKKDATSTQITTVANTSGAVLVLNGADKVIIDGLGKWTIQNQSSEGIAVKLQNGATFNEIRNLNIQAAGTTAGEGAITVSGEGNHNNLIKGNTIASQVSSKPTQIEYIANLPARPEVPSTTIEHINCKQEGANARLRVTMGEDHNLVAGYPVKLNEICGMTAANGNYTIVNVPSAKDFEVIKSGYTCPALDSFDISKLYVYNSIDKITNLGGSLKFKMLHDVRYKAGDQIMVSGVRGLTDANGVQTITSVNQADSSFTIALNTTQKHVRGIIVKANGDTLVPIRHNFNSTFVTTLIATQKVCFAKPHNLAEGELLNIYFVDAFKRDTLLAQKVEAVIDPYTIAVNIEKNSYKTSDLVYVSPNTIRVNADSTKDILRVKHIKGYHEASRLSHEGNVDFTLTEATNIIQPGTIVRCVGATNPGDGPYMGITVGWSKYNPTHYHYATWHSVFPISDNSQMVTTGKGFSGINPYCPAYISGPMLVRTTQPHELNTGDKISITDAPGLESVPGSYNITVLDSRNFVLDGSTWFEYQAPASLLATKDYAFRFFNRTTTARFNNNILGNTDIDNGVLVGIPYALFPPDNTKATLRPARGVLIDGQILASLPLGEKGLDNVMGDSIQFVGVLTRYWKMKGKTAAQDEDKYFATGIFNHGNILYNAYYQTDLLTAPGSFVLNSPLLYGITVFNGIAGSNNTRIEANTVKDPTISGIKMTGPGTGWTIDSNRIYLNQLEAKSQLTGIDVAAVSGTGSFIRNNYLGADSTLPQTIVMNENELYGIAANVAPGTSLIIENNLIAQINFPLTPSDRKNTGFFRGIVHTGGKAEIKNNEIRNITAAFFCGIDGSSDSGLVATGNRAQQILIDVPSITRTDPLYRFSGAYYSGKGSAKIQNNDFRNFMMDRSGKCGGGGMVDVPMGIITVISSSSGNIISNNFIEFKSRSEACVPMGLNAPYQDYGCGILVRGASSGLIDANRVGYYMGDDFRRELRPMVGIRILSTTSPTYSWRISNNMIRMFFNGINRASKYVYEDPQAGITIASGAGGEKHEVYNNSVFVGWDKYEGEYSGGRYSCLAMTPTGAAKVYNNIFINANGFRYTSPIRSNYTCIQIANLSNYEGDHNAYFWGCPTLMRTGKTVPYYGYAKIGGKHFMDYKSMIDTLRSSGNDMHSINANAPFVDPPLGLFGWPQRSLMEKDLALSEAGVHLVGKGKDIGITTDYYGNPRPSLPTLGAHEITGNSGNSWTGSVSSEWDNPANWSAGSVPNANTDVFISNIPEKRYMPEVDGLAEVNDIIIDFTPAGFLQIRKNGHLKIYGKAQFYNEYTLINTLGSRVEYAAQEDGQEICGLRAGAEPFSVGRSPYSNAKSSPGATIQNFTFETESYSRGTISNVNVTNGTITLSFAASHGLKAKEMISLWGLTGSLATLNGVNLPLTSVSGATATIVGSGFPTGSQSAGVEYSSIRKWFDIKSVEGFGDAYKVIFDMPNRFAAGQQLSVSRDTGIRIQSFLMIDSIIDAYSFITKSPVTSSHFVAAGCTGYTKLKVSGGTKGVYGPAEVIERLEFDNTTIKSDYYPDGTMFYAYLAGMRMIPRFPILRKLNFLSGTNQLNQISDFTGLSSTAYVDGPCAVEFGKYWTGTRWIPVGKNGKHRPMRVQINPNPAPDALGGKSFYMIGEMFDGKATDKYNRAKNPNDTNSLDLFSNNYFKLEMYAYEVTVHNNAHDAYYQTYIANYAQNAILPVENQVNIQNLTVGLSYQNSDIPQASNRNIVVVKDSGNYTPGTGKINGVWKDYTPDYWTVLGNSTLDSTSEMRFVEGKPTMYPGIYSIGAINQTVTTFDTVITNLKSSLSSKSGENSLIAYPNPTEGTFTLIADFKMSNISITSIMGQKVYEQSGKGMQEVQIERAKWNPSKGIYILKVSDGNISKSFKLIIY